MIVAESEELKPDKLHAAIFLFWLSVFAYKN